MEITTTIGPLSAAEAVQLKAGLARVGENSDIAEGELPGRRVGDLTAAYLATVGAVTAVRAIGLYLAIARSKSKVSLRVELQQSDGTKRTETIEIRSNANQAADPDMVRTLAQLFSLPVEQVEGELKPDSNAEQIGG